MKTLAGTEHRQTVFSDPELSSRMFICKRGVNASGADGTPVP